MRRFPDIEPVLPAPDHHGAVPKALADWMRFPAHPHTLAALPRRELLTQGGRGPAEVFLNLPRPGTLSQGPESGPEAKEPLSQPRWMEEFMEANNEVVWDWDIPSGRLKWSRNYHAVYGYPQSELESHIQVWVRRIHRQDLGGIEFSVHQALEGTGQLWSGEYRFLKANGEYAHVFDRGYILRNEAGRAVRMIGAMLDITPRVRVEQQLRKQREHLLQAQRIAGLGSWHFEVQTGRLYWSAPIFEINGVNPALFRGVAGDFFDLVHPDDRDLVRRTHEETLAGDQPMNVEHRIIRPDGEVRWVQQRAMVTRDEAGQPLVLEGTTQDITERKRAERTQMAVSELTSRLSVSRTLEDAARIIAGVMDQLFGWDAFFLTTYDSSNDTVRLVLSVDTIDGKKVEIPQVDPEGRPSAMIRRCLDRGADLINRQDASSPDLGSTRFGDVQRLSASLMLAPVRTQNGIVSVLSLQSYRKNFFHSSDLNLLQRVADVCGGALARISAEGRLAISERRLRAMFEQAGAGMATVSLEGQWLRVNPKLCEITGYAAGELEGAGLQIIAHPENEENLCQILQDLQEILAGRKPIRMEKRFRRKDGAEIWAEISLAPVRTETGQAEYFVLVLTDITERRNLEKKFLRAQRMESIGTLAGGVAHDLNNVLAPILMSVQFLRAQAQTAESAQILRTIENSARRGADIVRQVLTFARGVEGQRVTLRAADLVREMTKIVRDTFPRSIEVQADLGSEPGLVEGDATQLQQVLLNLLVNARDAMPQGGLIQIQARNVELDDACARMIQEAKPGRYVKLSVTDHGCGIPAGLMEKIFDPFFTTKEQGKGTGLGLSTSVGIVRSHGGFIRVESRVQHGTTFEVFLPAAPDTAAVPAREAGDSWPRGSGELVLVVDDEQPIRQIAAQVLTSNGYRVITAGDGTEALALYATNRTTLRLVLTDLDMPRMHGRELIAALRHMDPCLPIVASSGTNGQNAAAVAANPSGTVGTSRFLSKPYRAEQLLRVVAEELHEWRPGSAAAPYELR